MIVRPLLRVRRADVRDFVVEQGLAAVTDPTNHDPEQRRARARSEVLPALARLSGGPGDPVGVLCRLADLSRDDADALDTLAAEQAGRLVVAWGPVRAVRSDELGALSPALARRVVRLVLAEVRGRVEGLTADAVRAVLALRAGRALHVPGGAWVTAGAGWLAAIPPGTPDLPERPLRVPGTTALPELGLAVHADRLPASGGQAGGADGWPPPEPGPPSGACGRLPPRSRPPRGPAARPWAVLTAEVAQGLVVRARRPADRTVLPYGTRTVADLLVDLGVPRAARGLVPVVAGVDGQPAWVPGVAVRACGSAPAPIRLWIAPLR